MRSLWIPSVLFLSVQAAKRSYKSHDYFVLESKSNTPIQEIALVLDVEVLHQVGELKDHWFVQKRKGGLESRDLDEEPAVHSVGSDIVHLTRQIPRQREKRAPPSELRAPPPIGSADEVAERLDITDPLFPEQWHLVNEEYPEHTMNVVPVWEMGYTGKGVITSLIDDGLDSTSEDLAANFDVWDSHDFNDHEDLPTPKKSRDTHGTRCAGQIAATKNSICGVGIAYDSKVAGVRILSGKITDVDEAAALNFGFQNVSIYSCSWGPPDNGTMMEGPSILNRKAILNGINHGRGGKGSVFVFASGNGGAVGDQCNFDGYTNSIYSVTVASVDYKGLHPYYSEACAANMVVAYSSGSGKYIVTTDRGKNACADTHGGTSAAAPNVAGVFALVLEARPELTWRDIQHLCVQTAKTINPDDPDWERTAQGRRYSYKYGFGVLDAYLIVEAALDWKLVKPQSWIETEMKQLKDGKMTKEKHFSGGEPITAKGAFSTVHISSAMLKEYNFESLEHINVKVWIQHQKRGDVEVELVSPHGVKSVLAGSRDIDEAETGFPGWTFMTVKHWDENPVGDWKIRVSDKVNPEFTGKFLGWNMILWGSAIDAAKTRLFELPPDDLVFPPVPHTEPHVPTSTSYGGPREHSPTDQAPGDSHVPTLPSLDLVTHGNGIWYFIALLGVVSLGVGLFLWRRRKAKYKRLESFPMDTMVPSDAAPLLQNREDEGEEEPNRVPGSYRDET
ncbi:kex protein [Mycena floridula]|nr:kex protein [Mycena floridula]